MALSGAQRTRIAAGGPGLAYFGFTAKEEAIELFLTFGVFSIIQTYGAGSHSAITAAGKGVSVPLIDSSGILSIINTRGLGITSAIGDSKGTESDL